MLQSDVCMALWFIINHCEMLHGSFHFCLYCAKENRKCFSKRLDDFFTALQSYFFRKIKVKTDSFFYVKWDYARMHRPIISFVRDYFRAPKGLDDVDGKKSAKICLSLWHNLHKLQGVFFSESEIIWVGYYLKPRTKKKNESNFNWFTFIHENRSKRIKIFFLIFSGYFPRREGNYS